MVKYFNKMNIKNSLLPADSTARRISYELIVPDLSRSNCLKMPCKWKKKKKEFELPPYYSYDVVKVTWWVSHQPLPDFIPQNLELHNSQPCTAIFLSLISQGQQTQPKAQ